MIDCHADTPHQFTAGEGWKRLLEWFKKHL